VIFGVVGFWWRELEDFHFKILNFQFFSIFIREHHFAAISFDEPLAANDKKALVISTVFTHSLAPHPKEVAQTDKQRIKYEGNSLPFSAYSSVKAKTTFQFPNEEITFTGEGLVQSENRVTSTSSTPVAPFSSKQITAHYTNNSPFLTTEKLTRSLEISHWGNNLAVEEYYDVCPVVFSSPFIFFLFLFFFCVSQICLVGEK